ncbi:hypothetical protein PYJP_12590 [Pyrofollis japonicus]|uniref:FtsX-like permease family protein n=1 Tax=Pyrofollis japonicus TaxID=3060460 RepID=UPI00295A8B15|nr:FtsX-like permease family protein [Pyrofollis japonicus]BEP17907.1 hypothetical protein PYJP_12590 [Pyrofollis japonicus]
MAGMLIKASWRAVSRRKLESFAVIMVLFVGVVGLASIKLAASYSLSLAGKAWVYEVGSVVVEGHIPYSVLDKVRGIEGVERAKLIMAVDTIGYFDSTPISITLVYNPDDSYPMSYYISKGVPGVLEYVTNSQPITRPGDIVVVSGLGSIRITGIAKGIVSVSGTDITLFVNESLIEKAKGRKEQILFIVAPGTDPSKIASEIENLVRSEGGSIRTVFVQSGRSNPATAPLKSMANSLEIFTGIALVIAGFLIAGSEASLLERNVREIGVLKALGFSKGSVILYYAGYNMIRGAIGVAAGLTASVPVAEKLVSMGAREAQGSQVMELLMQKYPFTIDWGTLGETGLIALALILAATVLPPMLAYQVPTGQALRFTGLTGGIIKLKSLHGGKLLLVYSLRRMASRPWFSAFLVLFLAVSWGATASIPMSLRGLNIIKEEIKGYGFDGKLLFAASSTRLDDVVDKALSAPSVKSIEVWDFSWRRAKINGKEVSLMSCIVGNWSLGPRLLSGRWPQHRGEAAITVTVSEEFGIGIGDVITLNTTRGTYVFRVTGIVTDHFDNGLVVFIDRGDYLQIVHPTSFLLYYKADRDSLQVGLRIKRVLIENGIPASKPRTKADLLRMQDSNMRFLSVFLSIIDASILFVGVVGLAVLVIVDIAGRLREIGVLRAIGFTDVQILVLDIIILLVAWLASMPLVYLVGYAISHTMLSIMRDAVGYLTPVPRCWMSREQPG